MVLKLTDLDILKFGHTVTMVGTVFAGEGRAFLALFPEERGQLTVEDLEVLDMGKEDWQRLILQQDLQETEVTSRAADGTVKKAILRKTARGNDPIAQWQVFRRDGFACRYCAKNDVPLTVDHVVCWEEGGPTIVDNLVTSCRKCNKARGNTPYEKWLQSEHYRRVSTNLSTKVRADNEALVATLNKIPRKNYVGSR